jgi:hypothetical protein
LPRGLLLSAVSPGGALEANSGAPKECPSTLVCHGSVADAATPTFWSRIRAAPANRAKAKEYGFLLYAMLVSVAYAVAHDQVTATISPEYFLRWKGLVGDPMPFRWAVTALAMRASFGTGLFAGAVLLVANGPWLARHSAQLGYRELGRLSLVPLALAALFAVSWGGANSLAQIGATTARDFVAEDQVRAFVTVWAVHAGSYAGALVGVVASGAMVLLRRRRARMTDRTAPARSGPARQRNPL